MLCCDSDSSSASLGADWPDYADAEAVWNELADLSPNWYGIRYDRIEEYLERYAQYYGTRGRMRDFTEVELNGRRALQTELELFEAPRTEQLTLIEVGDGRVLAVVADAPRESFDAYRPWFSAALASLEISELPEEAWPDPR